MYKAILSVESIKQSDKECIEQYSIPELTLMENAGSSVVSTIKEQLSLLQNKTCLIFCGNGNNGGDGLVIARKLIEDNTNVDVFLLAEENQFKDSSLENLNKIKKLAEENKNIQIKTFEDLNQLEDIKNIGLIIDAIFGTGLSKNINEHISSLLQWINKTKQENSEIKVVSVDIPSGINGNTGQIRGVAVKADMTVTFAAKKLGLILEDAQNYCGEIKVTDIGIPEEVIEKNSYEHNSVLSVTSDIVSSWLPKRDWKSNKYSSGTCCVIAGSAGLSGAAYMSSQAAALIGAGAVVCVCPKSIQNILACKLTEVMTLAVEETDEQTIAISALEDVLKKSEKHKAVLIGPGLGRHNQTVDFTNQYILQTQQPMVIDADALYALSVYQNQSSKYLENKLSNKLLTPHWGEFKRLTGIHEDISYYQRIIEAKKYAQNWNCVILLKGFPSIVAMPSGKCFINQTGNPAAASAGHGDVLAGLCVGLLAQGLSIEKAALSAIHLAGVVADEYIVNCDLRTMLATKILETLPYILKLKFTQLMG